MSIDMNVTCTVQLTDEYKQPLLLYPKNDLNTLVPVLSVDEPVKECLGTT